MANEEHLKILKQGVEVWNKWREENPQEKPELQRVNLSNTCTGQTKLTDWEYYIKLKIIPKKYA